MAKTIVFKPEFETRLKELKIKTKFVKNIKKEILNNKQYFCNLSIGMELLKSVQARVNSLNEKEYFCDFIISAFVWCLSNEGYHFWNDLFVKYLHEIET